MPLYDMKCKSCEWLEKDMLLSYDTMKTHHCPDCGETTEPLPFDVGFSKGHSFHNPGDINQAELRYTDADGKKHVVDMKDKLGGPKGKCETPPAK